jgi:hypothetical protein
MRSLGMSPTIQELKKYLKDKGKCTIVYKTCAAVETKCFFNATMKYKLLVDDSVMW